MGTTNTRAGRGPTTMGAAMPTTTRTEKLVKVCWRTVTEREVLVPVSAWARMDGAEGDTGRGPLDDYLSDVEADEDGTVIERAVTVVEHGYES